ncbi:MAG: ParA family protein [Tenuifilaceae bacterium]
MAKIFSILNNKGGTGKTTTVLNLGVALSKKKKRVLLVDLDSQCNLTSALGLWGEKNTISDLFLGKCTVNEAIKQNGKIDLLPSSDKLLETEFLISSEPGREYMLKEHLEKIAGNYDYILMDCPPSLGTLSTNSLVAADYFIVPMQAENFAFIGLDRIMSVSEKVQKRMNPSLKLAGILFVKLVPRTKFSQAVITNLSNNEHFKNKIFNTFIRQDIALMESGAFKQSVFEYAPKSRGSEDYMDFANEIIKRYEISK